MLLFLLVLIIITYTVFSIYDLLFDFYYPSSFFAFGTGYVAFFGEVVHLLLDCGATYAEGGGYGRE